MRLWDGSLDKLFDLVPMVLVRLDFRCSVPWTKCCNRVISEWAENGILKGKKYHKCINPICLYTSPARLLLFNGQVIHPRLQLIIVLYSVQMFYSFKERNIELKRKKKVWFTLLLILEAEFCSYITLLQTRRNVIENI